MMTSDLSSYTLVFDRLGQHLESGAGTVSARLGLVRAVFLPSIQDFKKKFPGVEIQGQQYWKRDFDRLRSEGISCKHELDGRFDFIGIVPGQQRIESLGLIARSVSMLKKGGLLFFCCANNLGAKGYQKSLASVFDSVEVVTKSRCRLMVLDSRRIQHPELLKEWNKGMQPVQLEDGSLTSIPGLFGWNQIDQASRLLIQHLPFPLGGKGMDLGCGYGYLSHEILKKSPGIRQLSLLDADIRALDSARVNLKEFTQHEIAYLWEDISKFSAEKNFDWIVMNPPFHEGKNIEKNLGMTFIEKAASHLKEGGSLYMVCNHFLPYEKVIVRHFTRFDRVGESNSFKVIFARR